MGANDLSANRQALIRDAQGDGCRRQSHHSWISSPEHLSRLRLRFAIDADHLFPPRWCMVVRQGSGGSDRADQEIVIDEEGIPLLLQPDTVLMVDRPFVMAWNM